LATFLDGLLERNHERWNHDCTRASNTRFLARTGYSEEEIQTLETGRAILTTDSWYLGFFARVFILAVIGYGIYIVDGLVRRVGRKLKIDSAS